MKVKVQALKNVIAAVDAGHSKSYEPGDQFELDEVHLETALKEGLVKKVESPPKAPPERTTGMDRGSNRTETKEETSKARE